MHDYIGAGNDTTGLLKFKNPITMTTTSTGLMGWVPTAAFDPIFWLHHSNIDRIWQQWTNSPNGKAVMLAELKDTPWPYVFFDENGKRVEYTVEQALDIVYGEMDYDFDDTKLIKKTSNGLLQASRNNVLASTDSRVKINDQITDAVTQLKLKGGSNTKPVIIELTVSYPQRPKGVYEVYVNKPKNRPFVSIETYFAGFMTFFDSDHKAQGEVCNKGCCQPILNKRPITTFTFEVPYSEYINVQVYKHNGKHSTDLYVEKIVVKQ